MEKETLGLFLSTHPLKHVRAALRDVVDCSLAELPNRPDQSWVRVGGMVAEFKRIRTKNGSNMLFATLDDLEGQVEMLVFSGVYDKVADKVDSDRVLLVRGRVDHKERGETKLVAQEIDVFEPDPDVVDAANSKAAALASPKRVTLHVAPEAPAGFIDELRVIVTSYPGRDELMLKIGERTLLLGDDFRISATKACRAGLAALPGTKTLA
jgi:DNA polymerase-3 subunit alpha